MSKKLRDALLIIFIVLFVFITIITSLYASGFKFNLTWPLKFNRLLQKTGMLAIATKPSRAIIYLDEKPQQDLSFNPWKNDYLTTPSKVKNVLPGKYDLTLELEGYWPYQQTVEIRSGETTFVEDVILFKASSPLLVRASAETNLLISPDNRYLYTQATQEIINLKTDTARSLINPADTVVNDIKITAVNRQLFAPGKWLKNNKFFKAGYLYDPLKPENDNNYTSIIGSDVFNWRFDETSGTLYYQTANSINQFAISNQANTLILAGENYLNYQPQGEYIFTISKDQPVKLSGYLLRTLSEANTWILPTSGDYVLTDDVADYLSVYDNKNHSLYLFNSSDISAGPITINNIKSWIVLNNDALLYINDFEIYIFDLNTERSELITRRSELLADIIWNANGNYLIFSGQNTINVFDFKNRTTTNLVSANKVASPVLDERNKNLYFWASIDDQEGVYKISLQ